MQMAMAMEPPASYSEDIFRWWEDGARYRVRTCDPHRVKVVLYH